jgi:hypothetical protein
MACCLFFPPGPGRSAATPLDFYPSVGAITGISEPMTRQVVQRRDDNVGYILVIGTYSGDADGFQARSSLEEGASGTSLDWTPLVDVTIFQGHFVGIFRQPAGGFYDIQVRPVFQGQTGQPATVVGVGVGEVFITAGQSNATNWGIPTGIFPSSLVSCFDDGFDAGTDPAYPGAYWRWGYDPQPAIDASTGGSPWPTMATNLANALGVPIGLYAAGCGGTSIQQWLPGEVLILATSANPQVCLFDRLANAISYFDSRGGVRAVLWDQGETDYSYGTNPLVYQVSLQIVINQSRQVTGVPVKWMVAQVSTSQADNIPERVGLELAQAAVVDYIVTFPGPNTDLIGLPYRYYFDGVPVHFNADGLELLGGLWGLNVFNLPGFLAPGFLPPG